MEFETYTWEQVRAYAIIALNNLMNSANDIDLKGIKMCIDPLQTIHYKDAVVGYSQRLLHNEEIENKR